jgi:short-subunit dehydrogenase involved in D-alanine esterification of teichoic acids
MPFPYKTVLIVGATSGIGLAFAERLIAEGSKVIVVGRRKERLDAFVQKHGSEKSTAVPYDINDIDGLPKFVETVTKAHPELDCVFLNAGVQHKYDLTKPESLDLKTFHAEMATNFSRTVDLTYAFLPFLSTKQTDTSVIL